MRDERQRPESEEESEEEDPDAPQRGVVIIEM